MSKRISKIDAKPTEHRQHQDFDNILKKTFRRVYQSIIQKLLNLDLKNTVKLPTTFSRTKEKRPDFAVKVSPQNENPYIVHVEFQGLSEKNMHKRMLSYHSDIFWEYDLDIIQYVIYLGEGQHNMINDIQKINLRYHYTIIALNEIDANIFLNSDNPHELILAILCKYDKKDSPEIIRQILDNLMKIVKNERELHEYTTDLEILSGLRKLQSETKKQIELSINETTSA